MDRKMSRGLTIFEILVVIVIISILASTGLIYLVRQVNQARLREGVNMVVSALEEAKSKSSTSPYLFGVRITNNANNALVELCIASNINNNCQLDCNAPNPFDPYRPLPEFNLPRGVVLDGSSSVSILFDKMRFPKNTSCGLGMQRITLKSQFLGISKTICISRYGRIRIVEGQTCQ